VKKEKNMSSHLRRFALLGAAALLIGLTTTTEAQAQRFGRGFGGFGVGIGRGYGYGYPGSYGSGLGFSRGGYGYGYPGYYGNSYYGNSLLGFNRGYYGGYSYPSYYSYGVSPYYSSPSYYSTPSYAYTTPSYAYTTPSTTVVTPPTTYQSLYPPTNTTTVVTTPGAATTAVQANSAVIDVRVPDNARVYFGNQEMVQATGSLREFTSPPLEPGYDYQYTVRAVWMQNGQPVEQTRNVTVRAGQHVAVDFFMGS